MPPLGSRGRAGRKKKLRGSVSRGGGGSGRRRVEEAGPSRGSPSSVSRGGGTQPSRGDIVTVVTAVLSTVSFALVWPWAWAISAGRALWGLWLQLEAPHRGPCWVAPKDRDPGLGQKFSTQSLSLNLTLTPTLTPTLVLTLARPPSLAPTLTLATTLSPALTLPAKRTLTSIPHTTLPST